MPRPRYRIRYRKLDDLRLVGHHDLARLWERLFRRAEVKPAMSEGFHRRPRMNFPSALAVGIGGLDEVLELELADERDPADLAAALERHAPAGLSIASVEPMGDGTRFSQPAAATYEVPLPTEQVDAVKARIAARRAASLQGSPSGAAVHPTPEPDGPRPVETQASEIAASEIAASDTATSDTATSEFKRPETEPASAPPSEPNLDPWPPSVRALEVVDGVLRMDLRLGEAGAVRPRDLLALLNLAELESQGIQITRTRVELSP